ncbi:MAG: diacylglycerol/polyprenol kinase family protein [Candidatus Njordarchaeia archaeon]
MLAPFGLAPIIWNGIMTFIVLIYIMSVIKFMDVLVSKGFPQDVSRKIVHIAAGSWIIFWPLFDPSDWTVYFNIAVAVLWTLLFIVKGLTATPEDTAVKTMTRTGDPKELLYGPLMFTLVMEVCGTIFYMDFRGIAAMAVVGWGDGVAPLFGSRFGKHKYRILGNEKSVEGSISVFLFSLIALMGFSLVLVPNMVFADFNAFILKALIISSVATLIEAISPKNIDNILVPASVILTIMFLPF